MKTRSIFTKLIMTLFAFLCLFVMIPATAGAATTELNLPVFSAYESGSYDFNDPLQYTTLVIQDNFGGEYYTSNSMGMVYMDDVAPNEEGHMHFEYSSGYTHGTFYQITFEKDIPFDLPEDITISGTITLPLAKGYDYASAKLYQRDYSEMIPRFLPVESTVSGDSIILHYTKKVWDSFELMVEMKPVAQVQPKASLKLSKTNVTLYTGAKTHTATITPTVTGASKKVTWASKNPAVATVNNKGVITAVKAGTATITAKANGITKKVTVVVQNPAVTVKSGTKKVDAVTVKKGKSITLSVSVVPKGSGIALVKQTAAQSAIAKATYQNAKVTIKGMKKGSTTVKVKSGKGTKAVKVTVK